MRTACFFPQVIGNATLAFKSVLLLLLTGCSTFAKYSKEVLSTEKPR